jgi:hypothetical protein
MKNAVSKITLVESTWTDMPKEAVEVIEELWACWEYGNGSYYHRCSIKSLEEEVESGFLNTDIDIQPLTDFLRSSGIEDNEDILLHYWW